MAARSSSRPLRIAVNMTAYGPDVSGARNHTVGLCAALSEVPDVKLDLFSPRGFPFRGLIEAELGRDLPADRFVERLVNTDSERPLQRALRGRRWVQAQVLPERYDIFMTDYYPIAARVPTVLSIFDLRYTAGLSRNALLRNLWFRTVYPRVARKAALILTLTHARAVQTRELLGVAEQRIVVCGTAASRAVRTAGVVEEPATHMLAVHMGDERKGADVLCAALQRAGDAGPVQPLVLLGRPTAFLKGVLARYADLQRRDLLRYAGVVSEERLIELYRRASVLLHPSRYEGFGIPVLEAMTLGVPVVATADDAIQEIAGDAATYLAHDDVDGWAQAITRIGDPATMLTRPNVSGMARAVEMRPEEIVGRILPQLRRLAAGAT